MGTKTEEEAAKKGQELAEMEPIAGELVEFNWDRSLGRIKEIERFQRAVTVQAFIEIGREFQHAKASLKHGEFMKFVGDAGYNQRTVNQYMQAAGFANSHLGANLPYTRPGFKMDSRFRGNDKMIRS